MSETRVFELDKRDGSVEELMEWNRLVKNSATIAVQMFGERSLVQATTQSVSLLNDSGHWHSSNGEIRFVVVLDNYILLCIGKSVLVLLDANLQEVRLKELPGEISSIHGNDKYCIVSFWNSSDLIILDSMSLETVSLELMGDGCFVRSILVKTLGSISIAVVGEVNGTLACFTLTEDGHLIDCFEINTGTSPVSIFDYNPTQEDGEYSILVSSSSLTLRVTIRGDQPVNMRYKATVLNTESPTSVTLLQDSYYGENVLAVITKNSLQLASFSEGMGIQLTEKKLDQIVHKISADYETNSLVVLTSIVGERGLVAGDLHSFIKLLDFDDFHMLDSFKLQASETAQCVQHIHSNDLEFCGFVVGTEATSILEVLAEFYYFPLK